MELATLEDGIDDEDEGLLFVVGELAFDWELRQLYEYGRISSVEIFEETNAIANPFKP